MATAYTSLLGLALPVTGELAGTWGDTINSSITSLLDSAVSGTTTLSTDADVTLTTTTGAANQARQAILLCSGARTALRTITAPAQSKLYVVINSTTGGFGVKIVGVGPTTGVTVAAGKTAVVVWNGSDFVEISNAPILIGGTGTTSTLTLRSTSGVGTTGADIIFQTGNNGATEAMRIANAGDISIGTATPASIGGSYRTVTLNASGGSGFILQAGGVTQGLVFADSTLGLVLSGTSGGTTPITFRTTNLERMRITSAGNVGVGTTTPTARLHALAISAGTSLPLLVLNNSSAVDGTGTSIDMSSDSSGVVTGRIAAVRDGAGAHSLRFSTFAGSLSERMRIDSAGNVGIGTASPGSPLTVYAGNNQATIKVTNGPSANNVGITLESTGGNVVLNNGNGPFELSAGGSIRATLSTAGNLGLGITPSAWASGWTALQVRQGAMWSDSSARTFLSNNLYFDGTDRRYVLNGVAHEMVLDSGGSYIWKQAASGVAGAAISFTQAMTLAASGNLGIGTAAPAQLLHIASGDATALIENTAAASNATLQLKYPSRTWALANRGSDLSGAFAIRDATAGADRLVINTTGNLLIGGITPIGTARVELIGTNDATSQISLYRSDLTQRLTIGAQYIGTVTNTALDFYTNSTRKMRLAASGQLFLGTSTGSAIAQNYIDINGTANCALVLKATDVVQGYVYADDASDEFRLSATGTGNINALTFHTGGLERARITSAGNVGIGTATPVNALQVNGSFGRNAPVTKTTSFTLAATENWLICNGTATITVTLPAASSWTGREVMIKTIAAFTVVSASSNVVPLAGGAAGTAILPATAGAWATLVSDGANWIIMQS